MKHTGIYLSKHETERIRQAVSKPVKIDKHILNSQQETYNAIVAEHGLPNGKYGCDLRSGELVRL